MKVLLFITCFITGLTFKSNAQEGNGEKNFALGLTGGTGSMIVRDKVFTTFLYKANIAPLGIHFESKKATQKASFNLEFWNNPKFKTDINQGFEYKGELGDFYSREKDGYDISSLKSKLWNINYTQLFLVNNEKSKVKIFTGFDLTLLRFEKSFLQFEYISKLTDRIYSLGWSSNLELNLGTRHQFSYNLSIPIISQVKRSLYNSESQPGTVSQSRFTTLFGASQGLDSRINYRFMLSEKFSVRATYGFRYLQVTFPSKEQWAYNQGTLGLFFHF